MCIYINVCIFLQLYHHLQKTRDNATTEIILYDAHLKFGHKLICNDKELGNRTMSVHIVLFE